MWRKHTEQPDVEAHFYALVARYDDADGEPYLHGICMWDGGRWLDEDTGHPLAASRFAWKPESEVLAGVPVIA